MPARALVIGLAALLLVAAGCTDDGPDPRAEPTPPGLPQPFAAAGPAPQGWQTTQCSDLHPRGNSGVAARFGVPPTFSGMTQDRHGCSAGASFDRSLRVEVDPPETLLTYKEQDVDPYVGSDQGDAAHGDVSYDADARVLGGRRGERLDYYCYCDGQNLAYRVVQADGVRLEWITPRGRPVHEADYEAVARSLALLTSDRSICTIRGREPRAAFAPPVPRTWFIDHGGDGCRLHFNGRGYAEVVPGPRRPLPDPEVTWREQRGATQWRGTTWSRPGLQVTWLAPARGWQQEADEIRTFVRSVRLLPR